MSEKAILVIDKVGDLKDGTTQMRNDLTELRIAITQNTCNYVQKSIP